MPLLNRFLIKTVLLFLFLIAQDSVVFAQSVRSEYRTEYIWIDIPAQDLTSALVHLSEKIRVSIIINREILEGKRSKPVVGKFTVTAVINQILSGTGVGFKYDERASVVYLEKKLSSSQKEDESQPVKPLEATEEIFVTARHRDERLIDVPVSTSVVGLNTIENSNASSLEGISQRLVNTNFSKISGTNSSIAVIIRGQGQDEPLAGTETGVGFYLDDVYIDRPQSVVLDLYDIEKIEILRGPQGTLYGHNTVGGAIKIKSRKIEDSPNLTLRFNFGDYSKKEAMGFASTPIGTKVKASLALVSRKRDGFGGSYGTGEENYNKELFAARSKVEIDVLDSLDLEFSADALRDNSNSKYGSLLVGGQSLNRGSVYDNSAEASSNNHPLNENRVEKEGVGLKANWRMSENILLESILGYRTDQSDIVNDLDSSEFLSDLYSYYENRQFTQEFRFHLDRELFKVLMGVFYLDGKSFSASDLIQEGVPYSLFSSLDIASEDYSAFGSVDVSLSDSVSVSVGLRYTKDIKKAEIVANGFTASTNGALVSPYFGGNGVAVFPVVLDENGEQVFPQFQGEKSDSVLTPRLSMSWWLSEDVHSFFSYSNGFKSGGFDPRGVYSDPQFRSGFDLEKIDAYELGLKAGLTDGRGYISSSIFYNNLREVQNYALYEVDINGDQIPDASTLAIDNGLDGNIWGAEIELQVEPIVNFVTELGFSYLDYHFYNGGESEVLGERVLQSTPEEKIFLGQSYSFNRENYAIQTYISIAYQGGTYVAPFAATEVYQPGYTLVDSRISYELIGSGLSVALSVNNIFDKRYLVSAFWGSNTPSGFYGDPRTFTLSAEYKIL